jgi:uroporphyrinogen-III synthase
VAELDANALRWRRVVVTRALEQSEALVQALREAGAEPVVLPMVRFVTPDDFAPLDKALKHAGDFDWLLLTSQNAVRAVQERCVALNLGIAGIFEGLKIAAVGPASAEMARDLGLKVIYVASKYQGVALANELAGKLKGMRVFVPRSDRANPDLIEALVGHGAVVTEATAYKTERPSGKELAEIRSQLKQGVDAVLFFSPSAVNHFRDLLGQRDFERLAETCGGFAAIGPVTEAALREAGVEQIIVAKSATVPSLISELARHFAATPHSISAGAKRG